ncbi:MAG: LacI family DNA-binding transcriptional regulator [Ktedonobacteraceae bacterium]|nr:LacI family DNA-binding transcriptional regulator [Ktedonobacteraceae bacterium]MBO0792434.1 LacI family DNA-binding transcriptional regulator [Ktedonobacteraceae bacterium]
MQKPPPSPTKQTPSIVHVAERAGVSVATASRVMSNSSYPVSPTTRQKVLSAAAELGYAPNSLARSLRSQRSKLIAALVGDNTDPYFAEIMRGVEEVANEHGYLTIVCNTDRTPSKELYYLQALRDYRTDGIIFAGGGLSDPKHAEQIEEVVNEMTGRGAAAITLSQHTLNVPSIQADNFGGARDMTTRLIELGHQRIAIVTGPANLTVANVRMQGYMAAMVEKGLTIDPQLMLAGNFDQISGERAAQTVTQLPVESRPTAIFAANDETAFGVILGLLRRGIRVPQDISVCGFGDLPMSRLLSPALTTVQIPLRQLGRAGALALLTLLRREQIPAIEVIATKIIERESTAPPRTR